MSLNPNNELVDAVKALHGNPDFAALREQLGVLASALTHRALEAPPEFRVDATAYARGVVDVWVMVEAAASGRRQNVVKKPALDKNGATP